MTTIDWSAMTPREVFDALRTAPKVAGEWIEVQPRDFRRTTLDGSLVATVYHFNCWEWCIPDNAGRRGWTGAVSRESAMAAADAELVRRGWILVDDAKGGG